MNEQLIWALLGFLLPMLIGAAGVWLLVCCNKNPSGPLPPLGWSLAIGLGASVGMLALVGFPAWKSIEAKHWLLIAVLPAAVVVSLINTISRFPWIIHWLMRLVVVVGTVYVVLQVPIARWSTNEKIGWLGGIGALMLGVWALLHRYARQNINNPGTDESQRTRLLVFVLGATAGVIGGTTIASGSLIYGQLTASLAAAICGSWLATFGCKAGPISPRGMVDMIMPLSFGLLIADWYFGWRMQNPASPHIVAGLLAVAPLGLWATAVPWVRSRPRWQVTAWGVLAVFLLLIAAFGLAGYEANLRSQASGPSYY